jgi:hypothetical protein
MKERQFQWFARILKLINAPDDVVQSALDYDKRLLKAGLRRHTKKWVEFDFNPDKFNVTKFQEVLHDPEMSTACVFTKGTCNDCAITDRTDRVPGKLGIRSNCNNEFNMVDKYVTRLREDVGYWTQLKELVYLKNKPLNRAVHKEKKVRKPIARITCDGDVLPL